MLPNSEFNACIDCACLAARKQAQLLTRAFDERLRPYGLTINQFSMLTTLILGGPMPLTALSDRLGIDRTTMTRNLALGERNGLVRTIPDDDRRTRMIEIAPRGRDLAERALLAWREAQAAFANI